LHERKVPRVFLYPKILQTLIRTGAQQVAILVVAKDEHMINCSVCGRALIVKDWVNNGMAFLSHLKIDHGISYSVPQMTEEKTRRKGRDEQAFA
jgi:hypothetical protein